MGYAKYAHGFRIAPTAGRARARGILKLWSLTIFVRADHERPERSIVKVLRGNET